MSCNYILRIEDLANNPTPRLPVSLCLDTSGSMRGEPIAELNKGVQLFYKSLLSDATALYSAEVGVITFGGSVNNLVDFTTLVLQPECPALSTTQGKTPLGEAVNMALDLLDERKTDYQNKGVDYYQPWLVIMTDGLPNGDASELMRAIERTRKLTEERKLTIFPVGIGQNANAKVLNALSPHRTALKLNGLRFQEFFQWLSKSVSITSQSMPGEDVFLPTIGEWGKVFN